MSESPLESQVAAPAAIPPTRLMYWSVRRELWENRSIYLAPLAVAAVALFGFSLSSIAGIWEKPLRLNPAQPQAPYDMAAGLMMLTGIVVSVFYCLDALHGERRDRSILFWKSLPVSDLTTVLAKAEHSARDSAAAHLCDHRRHAVAHAAAEQRSAAGERSECGDVVDGVVVLAQMSLAAALPPSYRPRALARTNLLLASAGIRMAAPRDISMGGLAAGSDCRGRADCLPHLAFRRPGGIPIDRGRAHGCLDVARYVPNRPNDTYRRE